jgi:hypothetical protein
MLVDSKKKQLNPTEIIQEALKNIKDPNPPKAAFLSIMKELTGPGAWAKAYGNTLFILHRSQQNPKQAFFRALNADTANNYLASSRMFFEELQGMDLETVVTQFKDPTILNIFKIIGKPKPKGMGYKAVQDKKSGMYQVTLQLVPKA